MEGGTPQAAASCFFVDVCRSSKFEINHFVFSLNQTSFEPCFIPGYKDSLLHWENYTDTPLSAPGCSLEHRCVFSCRPTCEDSQNWKPYKKSGDIHYPDGSNKTIPLHHLYSTTDSTESDFQAKCDQDCGRFGGVAELLPRHNHTAGFCACRSGQLPDESHLKPYDSSFSKCEKSNSAKINVKSLAMYSILLSGILFLI
jgi:hypothetical protein